MLPETDWLKDLWGLVVTIVDGPDLCSSLFLLLILFLVGGKVIEHTPHLVPWGKRLALAVFLLYVGLRLVTDAPGSADELAWFCLRGLLAAGFACAVCWIMLPVIAVLWTYTIGRLIRFLQNACEQANRTAAQRRADLEREEARLRAEVEWERIRPERERTRIEAERNAKAEADRKSADQRRREAIRLECELLYDRHAAPLHDAFPRQRFETYLTQALADSLSPELIEQRAEKLRHLIQDLVEQAAPRRQKFSDIQAISAHFEARRQELDTLPYDDEAKASLRAIINMQESTSIQELLKSP